MRDDFNLHELTEKQKQKLCKFYNVKHISELEVLNNGSIIVKKLKGGSSIDDKKLYIQDHDGNNHLLDINEFIRKQTNPPLGYKGVDKTTAKTLLENFIEDVYKKKTSTGLSQLVVESNNDQQLLLFQQLITFYADKLKNVLCGNKINKKFIGASGHPGYSDVDFYNILKDANSIIIKGFAFCTLPKKGELYIDVVCGTGGTGELVRSIFSGLHKLQGKPTYISLDCIESPQAIKFYTSLGFKKSDQGTKDTINRIKKSKSKTFAQFCNEFPDIAGGVLYLGTPSKVKANIIYDPITWFNTIKKGEEPKLVAGGIGDFFKGVWKGAVNTGKNIINRFKPNLTSFTNQSTRTLGEYGSWTVSKLFIQRTPIMGILDKILNGLSWGTFQKAKNKYGYDKLFHLQLGAYVVQGRKTVKIILEKNETVDIYASNDFSPPKDFEYLDVPLESKIFTLNDLVNDARTQQGDDKFFSYDPFKNNCQWFISYLLHGQSLYGSREKNFLFQDLTGFTKELPKWLPTFARGVTDVGATVANLRGKGKKKDDEARLRWIETQKRKMKEEIENEEAKRKEDERIKAANKATSDLEEELRVQREKDKLRDEREYARLADIKAYNEGRLGDIKDASRRSAAQKQEATRQYNRVLLDAQKNVENSWDPIVNSLLLSGADLFLKKSGPIGKMTEKIVDASGVRDDPDEPNVPWYYKTLEEEDGPDWNDDYVGTGRPSMKLHAVIIKKPTDLNEAKQIASSIIKNPKKKFYRETQQSYRFRNISKQKFQPKSFRTDVINKQVSLVYGKPK